MRDRRNDGTGGRFGMRHLPGTETRRPRSTKDFRPSQSYAAKMLSALNLCFHSHIHQSRSTVGVCGDLEANICYGGSSCDGFAVNVKAVLAVCAIAAGHDEL